MSSPSPSRAPIPSPSSDSERDHRLLRRAVIINFAGLLGRGLWPLFLFLVARWYGAPVLGQFTLLQAPLEILLALCSTGFVDGIYRNVARLPGDPLAPTGYAAIALALRHVVGLGAVVFAAATLFGGLLFEHLWHRPGLHVPLILMTATVPIGGAISIFAATATAMMRNEGEALIKGFLVPALTVALSATPLARSYGVYGLAGAFLTAQLAGLLAAVFLFTRFASLRKLVSHRAELDRGAAASQRDFGLIQGLNLMLWMGVYSIDTILLGAFVGDADVARYRAGSELARLLQYARTQVSSAFVPLASRYLLRGQRAELQALLSSLPRTLCRGGFLLAGILSPLAVPLLPALLDIAVPDGAATSFLPFVSLLLLGHVVVAAFALSGNTLILAGHQRAILINSAIMTAVNLALGLALIPRFGSVGAATATLVAMTVAMVRQTVVLRLALGLSLPLRSFASSAALAAVALIASHFAAALLASPTAASPWPRAVIAAATFAVVYLFATALGNRLFRAPPPPPEPAA